MQLDQHRISEIRKRFNQTTMPDQGNNSGGGGGSNQGQGPANQRNQQPVNTQNQGNPQPTNNNPGANAPGANSGGGGNVGPNALQTRQALVGKIPQGWHKDKPVFNGQNPELALPRFFAQVEDVWDQGPRIAEQKKKALTCDYIKDGEWDIKEQWQSLPSYSDATKTWADWKKEVMGLYPEIEEKEMGSLDKLNSVVGKNVGVKRSELGPLQRFGVIFKTYGKQLTKDPAVLTNKDLVNKWYGALHPGFAKEVRAAVSTSSIWAIIGKAQPIRNARRDDQVNFEDLVDCTVKMAMGHSGDADDDEAGYYGVTRSSSYVPQDNIKKEMNDKFDVIDQQLASVRDTLRNTEHKVESSVNRFETTMEKTLNQMKQGLKNPGPTIERWQDREPQQHGIKTSGNAYNGPTSGCFFCKGGHLMGDCRLKNQYILQGKVVMENKFMKLPGGYNIPMYSEGMSRKERVDEYYKRKEAGLPTGVQTKAPVTSQMFSEVFESTYDMIGQYYDSTNDEIMSSHVQRSQMVQEANGGYPEEMMNAARASFRSSQPNTSFVPQATPMYLQNGFSSGMVVPTSQYLSTQSQAQASDEGSGSLDLKQLQQAVELIQRLGTFTQQAQEQFVAATRGQSNKNGRASPQNF